MGADVLREDDGVGIDVPGAAHDLLHDLSPPDRELAPEPLERGAEVAKRFEEERDLVGGSERLRDLLVEHEQRHDPLALVAGGDESGVVVHTQVARDEDDPGPHREPRYASTTRSRP